jgi:hypothetical protein
VFRWGSSFDSVNGKLERAAEQAPTIHLHTAEDLSASTHGTRRISDLLEGIERYCSSNQSVTVRAELSTQTDTSAGFSAALTLEN